jgi:hypothetical protein
MQIDLDTVVQDISLDEHFGQSLFKTVDQVDRVMEHMGKSCRTFYSCLIYMIT